MHFSGHIITIDSPDITANKKTALYLGKKYGMVTAEHFVGDKYDSEPLIFLNGCNSGEIFDIWYKSANLATALLNKNASGCVVTLSILEDKSASMLGKLFYRVLLENYADITYGETILEVRKRIRQKDPTDPIRLLFHLFGDPNAKLIYIRSPSDYAVDFLKGIRWEDDAA